MHHYGPGVMQEPAGGPASQDSCKSIVTAAKALSDPIRVRMIRLLAEGRERVGFPPIQVLHVPGPADIDGICVYEFQEAFHLGQSKVSYHLRILREAGLVVEESRGKWSFYSINRRALHDIMAESHRYFLL